MADAVVHLWIGVFGPTAPERYFENRPNDQDELRCEFALDQGQNNYDYDFAEMSYLPEVKPVREVVNGHSWSKSYIERVVALADQLSIDRINVFVLADTSEIRRPRSVKKDDLQLWYLGEFECVNE